MSDNRLDSFIERSMWDKPQPDTNIALPNETLVTIFEDLPPPTLADISRVSRRFRAVAERLLYSSISVSDILSESSPIPSKTLQCCQSILQHAHLIDAVKKVQIRWQYDPRSPASPLYLSSSCSKVGEAIRVLNFLESLELFLGPANLVTINNPPIHAIERIIGGCTFPFLRHCSLGAEWAKGVSPYGGVLDSFLASAPSLRHLRLSDHHAALNLPPEALPSLSAFRGSPDAAASLLPGRPVQCLSLIGQDSDVNRDNLPKMAYTSVPLRSLDLSAMSIRPILLRNISTYLPTVEVLKIRLALRHTLHYAMSGIRILAGLSSVLSAFPQLSHLDLSSTSVNGVGHVDLADEELSLCTEWSRVCPLLRRINFPSRNEWIFGPSSPWTVVQN